VPGFKSGLITPLDTVPEDGQTSFSTNTPADGVLEGLTADSCDTKGGRPHASLITSADPPRPS
jgi:hypothetical protein